MSRRKPSQPQQQAHLQRKPGTDRYLARKRDSSGSHHGRQRDRAEFGGAFWLYGQHAVLAALANSERRLKRLVALPQAAERLQKVGRQPAAEVIDKTILEALLPLGASHQGLAALAEPLQMPDLGDLMAKATAEPVQGRPLLVLLDQVTDPQNCGAVLRSAAAFGAAAVITPQDSSTPESGALAKAASGALEVVPYLRVTNLARTLGKIKDAGFWCLGLAGEAERTLAEADPGGPIALVLGAEGSGLRRLTRERCDLLVRLPTAGPIDSLNVSNAAAVALYIASGRR